MAGSVVRRDLRRELTRAEVADGVDQLLLVGVSPSSSTLKRLLAGLGVGQGAGVGVVRGEGVIFGDAVGCREPFGLAVYGRSSRRRDNVTGAGVGTGAGHWDLRGR